MTRSSPPIPEIARMADVSTATVDRVLNNRPGVREKTRAKVQNALDRLLRGEDGVDVQITRAASRRIAFVINSSSFFAEGMARVVRSVAEQMGLDPLPEIHTPAFEASTDLGEHLADLVADADGVVLIGRSSYTIDRVIDDIVAGGRPVVGATTDFPDSRRNCYVGMDQLAAGRLAGRLLGEMFRTAPAPILMHISRRSRTEDVREMGFRSFIREHFEEIEVQEIFNRSATDREAEALLDARLTNGPAPCAIFTTGAGLRGLARRLAGMPHGAPKPFLLGYELLPWSEKLLRDGLVGCLVAASSRLIVAQALQSVLDAAGGKPVRDVIHSPHLIFPENLDKLDWH